MAKNINKLQKQIPIIINNITIIIINIRSIQSMLYEYGMLYFCFYFRHKILYFNTKWRHNLEMSSSISYDFLFSYVFFTLRILRWKCKRSIKKDGTFERHIIRKIKNVQIQIHEEKRRKHDTLYQVPGKGRKRHISYQPHICISLLPIHVSPRESKIQEHKDKKMIDFVFLRVFIKRNVNSNTSIQFIYNNTQFV
jgi:hypothetical protein